MDKKKEMEVYTTIRHFREMKKITREMMADKLELTVSGYGKIERGEVDIQLSRLYRITEYLEVDLTQLLNFKISNIFNTSSIQTSQFSNSQLEINHLKYEYLEKYIKDLESQIEELKLK